LLNGDLRLDLLLRPPVRVPENARPLFAIMVHSLLADFLIEFLAVDVFQPTKTPKRFVNAVTVMMKLPVPIPVVFEAARNARKTQIGFVDTPVIRDEEIKAQIDRLLKEFYWDSVLEFEVSDVDVCGFEMERIQQIAAENNVRILKSEDRCDDLGVVRSFFMYVMGRNWSEEVVKREIEGLYKECVLCRCRMCKGLFNVNRGEDCRGQKLGSVYLKAKEGVHEAAVDGMVSEFVVSKVGISELVNRKQ
jgi:hypothetical protein